MRRTWRTVGRLTDSAVLTGEFLKPGLHEALLTRQLEELLGQLSERELVADVAELRDAEASDRISRHVAAIVARTIDRAPEGKRSEQATLITVALIRSLQPFADGKHELDGDALLDPARVLIALLRRLPDGRPQHIERPLTPLLDTTVLTNAPGEPAVGHELRAEMPSADAIDVVMAFIRWSGVRPLIEVLRRHSRIRKAVAGPDDDLHKQHRAARTRRAGTRSERRSGLLRHLVNAAPREGVALPSRERLLDRVHRLVEPHSLGPGSGSGVERSRLVLFATRTSWRRWPPSSTATGQSGDFVAVRRGRVLAATEEIPAGEVTCFSARSRSSCDPFQERSSGADRSRAPSGSSSQPPRRRHRHGQDGDGRGRLRAAASRPQPRADCCSSRTARRSSTRAGRRSGTRCATRPSARSGSAGSDPTRFEHVFASIQSLQRSVASSIIDPAHFDVVIVDEFHHAAAPSYEALLERHRARELLGLDRHARARGRARRPPLLRWPHRGRAAPVGRDRSAIPRAVRLLRHPRRARSARCPVEARPGLRHRCTRPTS